MFLTSVVTALRALRPGEGCVKWNTLEKLHFCSCVMLLRSPCAHTKEPEATPEEMPSRSVRPGLTALPGRWQQRWGPRCARPGLLCGADPAPVHGGSAGRSVSRGCSAARPRRSVLWLPQPGTRSSPAHSRRCVSLLAFFFFFFVGRCLAQKSALLRVPTARPSRTPQTAPVRALPARPRGLRGRPSLSYLRHGAAASAGAAAASSSTRGGAGDGSTRAGRAGPGERARASGLGAPWLPGAAPRCACARGEADRSPGSAAANPPPAPLAAAPALPAAGRRRRGGTGSGALRHRGPRIPPVCRGFSVRLLKRSGNKGDELQGPVAGKKLKNNIF